MWLVKNRLRATLTLRGLGVSIRGGEEFDLDDLGRDLAEGSNQVQVAFEEGYLENVHKEARTPSSRDLELTGALSGAAARGATKDELEDFKRSFLAELKERLPVATAAANADQLEQVRKAITGDVQALVGEFKLLRERFESAKGAVRHDPRLTDADIRARLTFLEEQERELLKNFETVGRQQRTEDGDVMDKADLLSNL